MGLFGIGGEAIYSFHLIMAMSVAVLCAQHTGSTVVISRDSSPLHSMQSRFHWDATAPRSGESAAHGLQYTASIQYKRRLWLERIRGGDSTENDNLGL